MAFLFKENGMINRLLLHHVRGHYPFLNSVILGDTQQYSIARCGRPTGGPMTRRSQIQGLLLLPQTVPSMPRWAASRTRCWSTRPACPGFHHVLKPGTPH